MLAAPDPDDVRRAADEILARPEYREPQPSLVDRAVEAVGDFLGQAFDTLTGGGAGSIVGLVVVGAILTVAVWLLARAVRTPWRSGAPVTGAGPAQGTTAPDDPDDWHAEAERLAAAGDHRGALRCRYQALVARVVRDRLVEDVPGRTPAELHRELAGRRADVDPLLSSITDRFERAWYGGDPVDAAAGESFRADVAALEATLARQVVGP